MATSIRLEPAIEQRLDRLAQMTGRPKADYLRDLVTAGLDDLEEYYSAASIMERVYKRAKPVYSAAQVRQQLGLAD